MSNNKPGLTKRVLLFVMLCGVSITSFANVTANIGATSNYMWRGQTQTSDKAAISGGIDFESETGFSAGIWVSTVDFSGNDAANETDFYGAYSMSMGELDVSIGAIYYMYTEYDDADFAEATLDFSYRNFSFGGAYLIDSDTDAEGDLYYYAGVNFDLPQEFSAAFTFGIVDPDKGDSGNYWQVDISKSEFTLSVVRSSDELDAKEDTKFFVSWSKSF